MCLINNFKKIVLILVTFLIFNVNVYAEVQPIPEGSSQGSDNPCGSKIHGYIACYSPKFQFRVTLVDSNGKMVSGTHSFDLSYSEDGRTYTSNTVKDRYDVSVEKLGYTYKYDSSEQKGADYRYVKLPIVSSGNLKSYRGDKGNDDHGKYGNFFNEFISNLENMEYEVYFDDENDEKSAILSVLLYYTGYIGKEDVNKNNDKLKDIHNNNYYLLFEPTYFIYYNEEAYQNVSKKYYGTSKEILSMFNSEISKNESKWRSGYLMGLSRNFLEQALCNLYTSEKNTEMSKLDKEMTTNCSVSNGIPKLLEGNPTYATRKAVIKMMLDDGYGYGGYLLNLKTFVPEQTVVEFNFDLELCGSDDGKLSFNVLGLNDEFINNNLFLVSGDAGSTSDLYCYDNVNYNFDEVIETLSGKKKILSNVVIPDASIVVNRICYFSSNYASSYDASSTSDYTNLDIKLNINGKEIPFVSSGSTDVTTASSRTVLGTGTVSYSFEVKYKIDPLYLGMNDVCPNGCDASIVFPSVNKLFGKSNKVLSELMNRNGKITFNDRNVIYNLNESDGSYNSNGNVCKLDLVIDDSATKFDFRVISLSNPFPARDGTSRLPGMNWLNEENYVFNYITNNRGIRYILGSDDVSPESMYTATEPMYWVTLDAKTMISIRQYNKNHSYDDISLSCNDDGKECISDFLRRDELSIDGKCMLDDNKAHKQDRNYDLKIADDLRNSIYNDAENPIYMSDYDFNMNHRLDTEDLEILFNNEKNTEFYTCANKSYKSGG